MQHHVARHFEQHVANEENARTNAEHIRRQTDIIVHVKRGIAYIHTVEIVDDEADKAEQNDPQIELANGTVAQVGRCADRTQSGIDHDVLPGLRSHSSMSGMQ